MKILVDLDKCQGYGNCVVAAPEVFDVSDAGKVLVLNPDSSDLAGIRRGVRECPARALELAE
jgi:ferredoxin